MHCRNRLCTSLLVLLSLTTTGWSQESDDASDVSLRMDLRGFTSDVRDLAFNPTGSILAGCADAEVRLWDVRTGQPLQTLRGERGNAGHGDCHAVTFTVDGCELLVGVQVGERNKAGESPKGAIRVYDVRSIGKVKELVTDLPATVTDLLFTHDGRFLVVRCADESLTILDWPLRRVVGSLPAGKMDGLADARLSIPLENPMLVAVSENKTFAISIPGCELIAKNRDLPSQIRDWMQTRASKEASLGGSDLRYGLLLSKGITVAYGTDAVQPKAKYWAASWQGDTAAVIYTKHARKVTAMAASARINRVATGDSDGNVHVWDASTGKPIYLFRSIKQIIYTMEIGDGNIIGFSQHSLQTGQSTWNHYGNVERCFDLVRRRFVDADPTGFEAKPSSPARYDVQVRKAENKFSLRVTMPDSTYRQLNLAAGFTPTCFRLILGDTAASIQVLVGSNTGEVLLIDLYTGKIVAEFVGHTGFITSLSTTADQSQLWTSASDGTIRLWDLQQAEETCEPALNLLIGADEKWIAWTSQGYFDAAPGCGDLLGWYVNNGDNAAAEFYPLHQYRTQLYRPDIVRNVLATSDVASSLAALEMPADGDNHPDGIANEIPISLEDRSTSPLPLTTDLRKPGKIAESAPPTVRVVSPADGSVVKDGFVHLLAEFQAENDLLIDEVRVLVNGRPVLNKGVLVESDVEQSEGRISFSKSIPLVPGDNKITLFASNKVATSNPTTVLVRYDAPEAELNRKPRLVLLSMGVSEYENRQLNLRYADRDAEKFAAAWDSQAGKVYETIHRKVLLNADATAANVQEGLNELRDQVTQRDVAVIFVSAHGIRDSKLEYYLAPHDVQPKNLTETGVHFRVVEQLVQSLPCKVLLMVDTCHAAGITGAKSIYRDPLYELTSPEYGTIVFASSLSSEISLEDEKWQHGAFTKAILDTFDDVESDLNGDGFISLTELEQSVGDRVAEMTEGQQHPVMQRPATIRNIPFYQVAK